MLSILASTDMPYRTMTVQTGSAELRLEPDLVSGRTKIAVERVARDLSGCTITRRAGVSLNLDPPWGGWGLFGGDARMTS